LLVGGSTFARNRVAYLLGAVVLFCLPVAGWYVAALWEWVEWPSGSTHLGLVFGIIAAAIIAFEMLLWPRKWFRGYRLGRTRSWMYWHVWLGILSLPLAIGHSGFHLGGTLTSAVMVLFLLVILSGLWGLSLQQFLPRMLLDEFPIETIQMEIPRIMAHHLVEAERFIVAATGAGDPIRSFFREEVAPYLLDGRASGSPLYSAARVETVFHDRAIRQPEAGPLLQKLKAFCEIRRQYDRQARIHRWLHKWLCVHVPLSVALCVLLFVHIVTALKYW